jgi:hypothetical protein
MIQRWKLRRELNRILDQMAALPALLYEPIKQRRYDETRDAQIIVNDGGDARSKKIAIFLVFQPQSLAKSVVETCTYLRTCGYSILLVANGGISEDSRSCLRRHVWRFIDRPNYGYDFGGYRDAVLKLEDWNILPDRLLILNDSIWFPVHDETSPVIQAEEIDNAITGLLMHTRASRERTGEMGGDGMIESYFFSIPAVIQRHDAFRSFWRDLRLSNSKARVIHRGERGFSKAMRRAGIPLAALSSRRQFISAISEASVDFLRTTLQYAVYIDDDFRKRGDSLLATFQPTEEWRNAALVHIANTVNRRRFNSSFYWAADRLALTNFMKKNKGKLFALMRQSFLMALSEGKLPLAPHAVMDEILTLSSHEQRK